MSKELTPNIIKRAYKWGAEIRKTKMWSTKDQDAIDVLLEIIRKPFNYFKKNEHKKNNTN